MEIQTFAPQTSFDTSNAGTPANGPKDDLFSQLLGQTASKAAERRADKPKPAAPERHDPVRPKPEDHRSAAPKPHEPARPADGKPAAERIPPRAPRADEAHAANHARKATHAEDKAAKTAEKVEDSPARPAAAKPDKPAKTERTETTDKAAKAAKTDAAAQVANATDTAETTDGTASGEPDDSSETPVEAVALDADALPDGVVVAEAEITIVETTVQLIAADGSVTTMTTVEGSAEVGVEALAEPMAVDLPASDPALTPEAAAQLVLDTALATAMADLQAGAAAPGEAPPQDPPSAAIVGTTAMPPLGAPVPAATPVTESPIAALADGLSVAAMPADPKALKTEGLPADAKAAPAGGKPADAATLESFAELVGAAEADAAPAKAKDAGKPEADTAKLPDSLADLVGAKPTEKSAEKSADKGTGRGQSESGYDGAAQPQQTSASAQPQRTAEAVAATAESTVVEAVAPTASTAAPAEATGNKDPGTGQILPTDAVKSAAPTEAPAFTTLRPVRSPHMPMGVQDQVAVNIHKHVAEGNEKFTIMLRPEELGRIDIRLEIGQDGRVSAMVAVDKPQTLDLLMRDQRGLERALQDAGLKADSDSLSFSLRGDGASFADQQGGDQRGAGRRGRGAGGGDEETDAAILQTLTLAPGRVDVRV